ncbi:MAG: TIGR04219 family outer membrane beta-barrel protein [Oceanobacter sp.]
MKKTMLALAIAALSPVAAQADLLFTVGAKASIWAADPSGQLDDGVSTGSDGLNLKGENGDQITLYFEHPLPMIPNVQLKKTSLSVTGNGTVNVNFNNQAFNGDVHSKLDVSHTDYTLYWGLPIPFVDINFGLTGRKFAGSASVASSSQTESVDIDLMLPMAYGAVSISTPFGVYASADINYIALGDNKLSDISYGLGYNLPVPVVDLGLEAGYRKMKMATDPDDTDVELDVDLKGMYYGLALSVGF